MIWVHLLIILTGLGLLGLVVWLVGWIVPLGLVGIGLIWLGWKSS